MNPLPIWLSAAAALACVSFSARAEDVEATLVIDALHRFQPDSLTVPAGKKIKLTVENRDVAAEEFESFPLNREKVIAGNSKAIIYIGPLQPGRYPFIGEFHADTAHGVIVAQ